MNSSNRGVLPGISMERSVYVEGQRTTWYWDSNFRERVIIIGIGPDAVEARLDDLASSAMADARPGGILVTFKAGDMGERMIKKEWLLEFVIRVALTRKGFEDASFVLERGQNLDQVLHAIRHGLPVGRVLEAIRTGLTYEDVLDELFFVAGV